MVASLVAEAAPSFGYLVKDRVLDTESFLERVQVIADAGTAIDPLIVDMYGHHTAAGFDPLTDREAEVLRLVASGRSNAGIAVQLLISRRTVDAHLRSTFTKLGIKASPRRRSCARRAELADSRLNPHRLADPSSRFSNC